MSKLPENYRTLQKTSEGLYKEKGSKFMAFAHPVDDKAQADAWIEHYRNQFHDARHVCYAYVLGYEGEESRTYDDGEPGHTAGDPIKGQMLAHELTQVLVVVVRYFGGTKLGKGGLIQAYKAAAADALTRADIVNRSIRTSLWIRFPYEATRTVQQLIKQYALEVGEERFDRDCQVKLLIKSSVADEVQEYIHHLPDIQTIQ